MDLHAHKKIHKSVNLIILINLELTFICFSYLKNEYSHGDIADQNEALRECELDKNKT